MITLSLKEAAEFFSSNTLDGCSEADIESAIESWLEHMWAGGFAVGYQVPDNEAPFLEVLGDVR